MAKAEGVPIHPKHEVGKKVEKQKAGQQANQPEPRSAAPFDQVVVAVAKQLPKEMRDDCQT